MQRCCSPGGHFKLDKPGKFLLPLPFSSLQKLCSNCLMFQICFHGLSIASSSNILSSPVLARKAPRVLMWTVAYPKPLQFMVPNIAASAQSWGGHCMDKYACDNRQQQLLLWRTSGRDELALWHRPTCRTALFYASFGFDLYLTTNSLSMDQGHWQLLSNTRTPSIVFLSNGSCMVQRDPKAGAWVSRYL